MGTKLLDKYTKEELREERLLFIDDLELSSYLYVKEINPYSDITIGRNATLEYGLLFLKLLKKNNHKGIINIEVIDKLRFNALLKQCNITGYDNVYVIYDSERIKLNDYIFYENYLDSLVKPVANKSPFVKFLYVYNLVKHFKNYKESENKSEARNLYSVLKGDSIVCVGFSVLLVDLLKRVGIEAYDYSTFIFERNNNKEETLKEGHERVRVHLVDSYFGIDGYYVSDPTWDNYLDSDFYNHALITTDELNKHKISNFISFPQTYFDVSNVSEFIYLVNKFVGKYNPESDSYNTIYDVFRYIMITLKKLDNELYMQIYLEYGDILDEERPLTLKELKEIVLKLAMEITKNNNNSISGETLKEGIKTLYRDIYKDPNYLETVDSIMEENRKREKLYFPDISYTKGSSKKLVYKVKNRFDIS